MNKFQGLEEKFKKSELNYLLVYRFVGGIPFAISNVLPCIFNVKTINFLIATLIGIVPQVFIWVSLGSGLEKIIDQNEEAPNFTRIDYFTGYLYPNSCFCYFSNCYNYN